MVTLEDFLTDLYSLFDQKIHCTLEQQNLVFSGKIDRINFADFCYENQKEGCWSMARKPPMWNSTRWVEVGV